MRKKLFTRSTWLDWLQIDILIFIVASHFVRLSFLCLLWCAIDLGRLRGNGFLFLLLYLLVGQLIEQIVTASLQFQCGARNAGTNWNGNAATAGCRNGFFRKYLGSSRIDVADTTRNNLQKQSVHKFIFSIRCIKKESIKLKFSILLQTRNRIECKLNKIEKASTPYCINVRIKWVHS